MWEVCRDKVEERGAKVLMETRVTTIHHEDGRAVAVTADQGGTPMRMPCSDVISSMPFSQLLKAMDPPASPEAVAAADDLAYRDFLTVALVVPEDDGFPDNWIYVHAREVNVGRIQNFGSWSPYMVKEGRTCLGLEYFVFEGDELWSSPDEYLVKLGTEELVRIGLLDDPAKVEAGYVVRMPKAYPMYDERYRRNVDVIREWLAANTPNVHPVGRNGMHKYNNQDHSMYTAMLTVENIVDGASHDIWAVNVEEEYHEEAVGPTKEGGSGRDAPLIPREVVEAHRSHHLAGAPSSDAE
jgi:protoporphyrinogen oxidase